MRTSAVIGLGYALFASGAIAGCYSGGAKFNNDRDRVKTELVNSFCEQGIILGPALKTSVPISSVHVEKCYNIGNGRSATFRFENLMPNINLVKKDECKKFLRDVIDQCENGGETEYMKVKVKADPNDQACV
ncbi:hypothetical protein ACKAV7_014707 [Fusarium commune]